MFRVDSEQRCCRQPNRHGALLVEMVVLTVVIGVVATVLLPMLAAVRQAGGAARHEQLALIELHNLRTRIEQNRAESPAALRQFIGTVQLGEWFRQRCADAELLVAVDDAAALPDQERLVPVRMTITNGPQQAASGRRRLSLVVWIPLPGTEQQQ